MSEYLGLARSTVRKWYRYARFRDNRGKETPASKNRTGRPRKTSISVNVIKCIKMRIHLQGRLITIRRSSAVKLAKCNDDFTHIHTPCDSIP
ncbi:hypothetical protein Pcinc_003679 [Petrolisthes cinctipes]|uniref:Uncharacterized protein n=1 Tax=Petrolisthes cinctipes TaxID=88211 RepID=A0AAE1L0X9_PETCI|nr:hypothetical protein Pcinc_003679 [Petrolisthes cinctipes]